MGEQLVILLVGEQLVILLVSEQWVILLVGKHVHLYIVHFVWSTGVTSFCICQRVVNS